LVSPEISGCDASLPSGLCNIRDKAGQELPTWCASSSIDQGRLGARRFGLISTGLEKCFTGREFYFVGTGFGGGLQENAEEQRAIVQARRNEGVARSQRHPSFEGRHQFDAALQSRFGLN
jgi:hypothetical protein